MVVIRYVAVRIAVMYVGELVEYAERNELLRRSTSPYTAVLYSANPKKIAAIDDKTERQFATGLCFTNPPSLHQRAVPTRGTSITRNIGQPF